MSEEEEVVCSYAKNITSVSIQIILLQIFFTKMNHSRNRSSRILEQLCCLYYFDRKIQESRNLHRTNRIIDEKVAKPFTSTIFQEIIASIMAFGCGTFLMTDWYDCNNPFWIFTELIPERFQQYILGNYLVWALMIFFVLRFGCGKNLKRYEFLDAVLAHRNIPNRLSQKYSDRIGKFRTIIFLYAHSITFTVSFAAFLTIGIRIFLNQLWIKTLFWLVFWYVVEILYTMSGCLGNLISFFLFSILRNN